MDEILARVASYPGIYALCATAGILVPVSEDVPVLYAGLLVGTDKLSLFPTLAVAFAGVWTRDMIAYSVGWFLGRAVLENRFVRRFLGQGHIDRALESVSRRGGVAVITGRFMVGIRASVFLTSGALGVRPTQFVLYDTLGLCFTVPLTVGLGYFFGEPAVGGVIWLVQHKTVGIAVVLGILAVVVGVWTWRRRRAKAA
jgi:membrane protein DedA with SNARE-associated domain